MEKIVKFQILYLWVWESLSIIMKMLKMLQEIMGDKEGIQLSTKEGTLSTSGIVLKLLNGVMKLTQGVISLHATNMSEK